MKQITIYTDGACSGNPGKGGWGALLQFNGTQKELSGATAQTTNNRMELTAAIEALKAISEPCKIDLYTDSKYVLEGINNWISNWKKNNWRTANKKPVKNIDLWQELDIQNSNHNVTWHWVKGHSGNIGNEHADELATNAIQTLP